MFSTFPNLNEWILISIFPLCLQISRQEYKIIPSGREVGGYEARVHLKCRIVIPVAYRAPVLGIVCLNTYKVHETRTEIFTP